MNLDFVTCETYIVTTLGVLLMKTNIALETTKKSDSEVITVRKIITKY